MINDFGLSDLRIVNAGNIIHQLMLFFSRKKKIHIAILDSLSLDYAEILYFYIFFKKLCVYITTNI